MREKSILLSKTEIQINAAGYGQSQHKNEKVSAVGRTGVGFCGIVSGVGSIGQDGKCAATHQNKAQNKGQNTFHDRSSQKRWVYYKENEGGCQVIGKTVARDNATNDKRYSFWETFKNNL